MPVVTYENQQDIIARLAALEKSALVSASQFLPNDYTVATLPPAVDNDRKYAWVTDLHDGQADRVISAGGAWKPVRPLAAKVVANANSDMTLRALVNSPVQIMQGTLLVARTVALSVQYAYPGARIRVKREAGGLFGMLFKTLDANNALSATIGTLGASSWADYDFDGTKWIQTASGGLL